MIEVIYQFALSMDPRTGFNGKSTSCLLTIITIYLSSLRVSVRNKTHTDSSLCKESLICSKKAVLRYYQLFHNSSFQSKVSYNFLHIESKRFELILKRLTFFFSAALNTRDIEIVCITLKILQQLVVCSDTIGEALVPYYRQILPVLNLMKTKNDNMGDKIDYSQRKGRNLGDLIQTTLEMFE